MRPAPRPRRTVPGDQPPSTHDQRGQSPGPSRHERHRDRRERPAAPHSGTGARALRRRGGRAHFLRSSQGEAAAGRAGRHCARTRRRQTRAGDGDFANARRRGQDHHHHRPGRCAESAGRQRDRGAQGTVLGALLRHEGRRHRRWLGPNRAHDGHQPTLQRRPARRDRGPQPACHPARQPSPLGQRAGCGFGGRDLAARPRRE